MIKLGRCDCGRKGIKIKWSASVCAVCDKIEREVIPKLFQLSEEQKQRNKENHWARYTKPQSYLE